MIKPIKNATSFLCTWFRGSWLLCSSVDPSSQPRFLAFETWCKTPNGVRCISNLSAEHNLGDLSTSTNVKIFPASVHLWCSAGGWLKHNQSATNFPSVDMFGALVLNARYLQAKKVLQS